MSGERRESWIEVAAAPPPWTTAVEERMKNSIVGLRLGLDMGLVGEEETAQLLGRPIQVRRAWNILTPDKKKRGGNLSKTLDKSETITSVNYFHVGNSFSMGIFFFH